MFRPCFVNVIHKQECVVSTEQMLMTNHPPAFDMTDDFNLEMR